MGGHVYRGRKEGLPSPTPSEPRYTAAEYQDVVQRRLEMAVPRGGLVVPLLTGWVGSATALLR